MLKTEIITIKENNKNFKFLVSLCKKSKSIYNYANYLLRQEFINENNFIGYSNLDKLVRKNNLELYSSIPNNSTQQVLMNLVNSWKSYFSCIKDYSKNKYKYNGKPKIPKYKKQEDLFLCTFTSNQFKLKGNTIHLPKKTNILPIKIRKELSLFKIQQIRIIPKLNSFNIEIIYLNEIEVKNNNFKNKASIDLGINNFCTIYSSQNNKKQNLILNGKVIKSINQFYNKRKAKLQSELPKGSYSSKRIKNLTDKRNRKINYQLHNASKSILNYCLNNEIGKLAVGYNSGWKQNVKLGSLTNQNFTNIPYLKFINLLEYKLKENGIELTLLKESYTSKCSALDLEEISFQENYKGSRIKRGLFKSEKGILINADLNGAINIYRKAFGTADLSDLQSNRNCVVQLSRVNRIELKPEVKLQTNIQNC